ncbi:MAG: MbnP family protein [Flavipsychrobacter sp.]
MKFSKLLSLSIALFFGLSMAKAQTPVELHITHKLSGSPFSFNTNAKNNLGNDFFITRIEYYVSKISIKHDGGMVTDVPNHYILANGDQNVTSQLGSFNITNVEAISFYIGVDTPINHADPSLQPNGHPLAPKSPSMHWGWQGGYRFIALEGKAGSSLDQVLEIHSIGDVNFLKTTVPVSGITQNGKIIIAINADYTQGLKNINISSGLLSHADNMEAAALIQNFNQSVFYPGHPVSVATTAKATTQVNVYPNPSNGSVNLSFGSDEAATIAVYDVQGRLVLSKEKAMGQRSMSIQIDHAGLYFLKATAEGASPLVQKLEIL